MNRGISQKIGNLGEIHVIIPDQLTGKINFHSGKKFNGSTLVLLPKKFLKLRTSNKIVMGDFFDGKALVDMIFHVVDDPATERRFCVAGIIQTGRYRVSGKCITTDNVDQNRQDPCIHPD